MTFPLSSHYHAFSWGSVTYFVCWFDSSWIGYNTKGVPWDSWATYQSDCLDIRSVQGTDRKPTVFMCSAELDLMTSAGVSSVQSFLPGMINIFKKQLWWGSLERTEEGSKFEHLYKCPPGSPPLIIWPLRVLGCLFCQKKSVYPQLALNCIIRWPRTYLCVWSWSFGMKL